MDSPGVAAMCFAEELLSEELGVQSRSSNWQPDDAFHVLDVLLITDLEIKPFGNGSRKKRRE